MKKSIFYLTAFFFLFSLFSCATLQKDKLISGEESFSFDAETQDFEEAFRKFDSESFQTVIDKNNLEKYVANLEKSEASCVEPALMARFKALNGLFNLLNTKPKRAKELYDNASTLQPGDECVLLLNSRLKNTKDESLLCINEYLLFDSDNPVFLLEKALLCYQTGAFAESVAAFDTAFLLFEQNGKSYYREYYSFIREKAWKAFSLGTESFVDVLKSEVPLSFYRMISLTMEHTSLLDDFTGDSKVSVTSISKNLEDSGFFRAIGEDETENSTSKEFTESKELSRTLCARFLWNLYVHETGNKRIKDSYSKRMSRLTNPHSPIQDIELSSLDFDACLGVVEKEIMNLTDGKLFAGDKIVSEVEYIEYAVRCQEKSK